MARKKMQCKKENPVNPSLKTWNELKYLKYTIIKNISDYYYVWWLIIPVLQIFNEIVTRNRKMLNPSMLANMIRPKLMKVTNLQGIFKRGVAVTRLHTHQLEIAEGR